MHLSLLALALALLLAAAVVMGAEEGFAADRIDWVKGFAPARDLAIAGNKPLVVLVHKTWCGACKQLKRDFNTPGRAMDRLEQVAKQYVMVHLQDDESETPELKELLSPSGAGYIPRVLFFDQRGELNADVKSTGNAKYPYFYHNAQSLTEVMEAALQREFAPSTEL